MASCWMARMIWNTISPEEIAHIPYIMNELILPVFARNNKS